MSKKESDACATCKSYEPCGRPCRLKPCLAYEFNEKNEEHEEVNKPTAD